MPPFVGSYSLNSKFINVVLPEPVAPKIPKDSPFLSFILILVKSFFTPLYEKSTLSNTI